MKKIIGVMFFSLLLLLSACSDKLPIETNMKEKVADFSYTNQDNETVSRDDLAGQWWIADFIFTNCETVCIPMTTNMSALQDDLAEIDIPMQFISFSVDPDYDNPDVLQQYADDYNADLTNWDFLTGYDFETIRKLSIKSFRAPLKAPAYGSDQITHDLRFFLVDPEGNIVKGYEGVDRDTMESVLEDIQTLDDKGYL